MFSKDVLYRILDCSGFSRVSRAVFYRRRSLSLLFHGVFTKIDSGLPKQMYLGLLTDEFEQIIKWINEAGLPFVSTEEFIQGKRGVHITFDDGYTNNYSNVLPILEKHKVPALIFVSTRHLRQTELSKSNLLPFFNEFLISIHDNKFDDSILNDVCNGLTHQQLKILSKHPLIDIGCHTINHPYLSKLSYEEQLFEIQSAQNELVSIIGCPVPYFSYPYGDYNKETLEIVKKQSFEATFAVVPKYSRNGLMEIPRIGIYSANENYLSLKFSYLRNTFNR